MTPPQKNNKYVQLIKENPAKHSKINFRLNTDTLDYQHIVLNIFIATYL